MGWEDDRGVSEVLGAILLFGILVTAVGGYQAFVVPHQNEEIEHEHDRLVNDEFPGIQAAISNAAGSGEPRTASITLGTDYPFRVFTVGMSPTTGNIKTGEPGTLSVEGDDFSLTNTCGLEPETRSIQYQANYHEYDNAGRFVYENGVSYREVEGNVVVRNEQELVDGNTITLFPLSIGSFDRTSSASEQLRFRPGQTGVSSVEFEDEVTLLLPTELTGEQWETILDGEDRVTDVAESDGTLELTLKADQYWFRCTPVGVNQQPEQNPDVPRDDLDDDDRFNDINPNSDGTIVLTSVSNLTQGGDNSNVSITLDNRTSGPGTISIERARLNYLSITSPAESPGSNSDNYFEFADSGDVRFYAGGEQKRLEPPIPLGQGETEIGLEFGRELRNDDFYVLTLEFSNGDINTYFISHPLNQGA